MIQTTVRKHLYLFVVTAAIVASTIIASPAFASAVGTGGVTGS